MPLLTLSRPRQGAKNIYDSLPQRQEDLGRFFFLIHGLQTLLTFYAQNAPLTTQRQLSLNFQTVCPSGSMEEEGIGGNTGGLESSKKGVGGL